MIWAALGGMVVGVAVGEYYRRVIDGIRKEQIADLRSHQRSEPEPAPFDHLQRAKPRRQMVTPEQHAELQHTGHTAGRYKGGEPQ